MTHKQFVMRVVFEEVFIPKLIGSKTNQINLTFLILEHKLDFQLNMYIKLSHNETHI